MLITSQQGHEHVAATGQGFSNMTAGLSQGFAIQTFFIPVLKKNENRKQYKLFLIITYLIGTAIYLFIGYGGSFGFFLIMQVLSIESQTPMIPIPLKTTFQTKTGKSSSFKLCTSFICILSFLSFYSLQSTPIANT